MTTVAEGLTRLLHRFNAPAGTTVAALFQGTVVDIVAELAPVIGNANAVAAQIAYAQAHAGVSKQRDQQIAEGLPVFRCIQQRGRILPQFLHSVVLLFSQIIVSIAYFALDSTFPFLLFPV